MQQTIWVILALVVAVAVGYSIISAARTRHDQASRPLTGPGGAPSEIESADAYRNHLAMARWIELQLKDDLVRSSVDEEQQQRAKRLLDEFYGEER